MTDRIAFKSTATVEGRNIRGSVTLKGARTWRNNEWLEVDPAALVKADASNVMGLFDHDPAKLLGRTSNGTLTFSRTETGIDYEIRDVPNTTAGNDALELAKGGYLNGSSFAIEGLRSEFLTDPDGTRVRRITSIKRLADISPVFDPAFSSSVAAFSKESDVTDKNEEPVVAPEPEAPKATFAEQPKSGKDYWAEFAKDLSLETIEGTMDALFSEARGDLRGDVLDRYEGFAKELRDRKRADATARARIEALQFAHNAALGRVPKAPEAGLFASDDYKHAFDTALRTGDRRSMEQFAQSIAGDGTQGGFTVPDEYRNVIIERKKAFGGIQAIADEITTGDGRSLPWPTNDDTSNSAVIASEGSAAGSGGADLVFGGLTLGAYTYDATGASNLPLLVSKELLQDAAFDIGNFVARKLGERLGRKMAAEYATGSGSGAPTGLLTKSADVMTATTLYKALSEHLFQVDSAYRDMGNCRWVMSDTIFAKVYDSVDKQGRPLFTALNESGGQRGPSGLLLGYPVTLDQGAGSSVAFGDIRQGYIIRNVRDIQIDVDAITGIKSRQVAYHAWARTDAGVQDAYAYSVSSYSGVSADAVG